MGDGSAWPQQGVSGKKKFSALWTMKKLTAQTVCLRAPVPVVGFGECAPPVGRNGPGPGGKRKPNPGLVFLVQTKRVEDGARCSSTNCLENQSTPKICFFKPFPWRPSPRSTDDRNVAKPPHPCGPANKTTDEKRQTAAGKKNPALGKAGARTDEANGAWPQPPSKNLWFGVPRPPPGQPKTIKSWVVPGIGPAGPPGITEKNQTLKPGAPVPSFARRREINPTKWGVSQGLGPKVASTKNKKTVQIPHCWWKKKWKAENRVADPNPLFPRTRFQLFPKSLLKNGWNVAQFLQRLLDNSSTQQKGPPPNLKTKGKNAPQSYPPPAHCPPPRSHHPEIWQTTLLPFVGSLKDFVPRFYTQVETVIHII